MIYHLYTLYKYTKTYEGPTRSNDLARLVGRAKEALGAIAQGGVLAKELPSPQNILGARNKKKSGIGNICTKTGLTFLLQQAENQFTICKIVSIIYIIYNIYNIQIYKI